MYIYTHALVGGTLGAWMKNSRQNMILGALGGVLPDVPMGTQIVWALLRGKGFRDVKWRKPVIIASDAFHSLPLGVLLFAVGRNKSGLRSLALNMIMHSAMDVMSHAVTADFKATYLWPLPWQLGRWLSVWEYRRDSGKTAPKPQEIAVNALALAFLIYKARQQTRLG